MKEKIFTLLIVCALGATTALRAQVLLEDHFDYPVDRPIVLNPEAGTSNTDEETGWITMSNSRADVESLKIVEGSLSYQGYESPGNALYYDGSFGPGFFKMLDEIAVENETVYISFLINFDAGLALGSDYFFAIKMEENPSSFNWGGRIYAMDNEFTGDIILGINKLDGETQWAPADKQLAPGETHFVVMRYDIGDVTETPEEEREQSGNFDDEMRLYLNPDLSADEPEEADLEHIDPDTRDIRRWGASQVFGGAAAIYQRTPEESAAPKYTIDAIKVGRTWEDVVPVATSSPKKPVTDFNYYVNNKRIYLSNTGSNFNQYSVINLAGQPVLSGTIGNNTEVINAEVLRNGVYILNLTGKTRQAVKLIIK